ncbi:MAG: hypothetical protein GXY25_07035 [Pirellulaceae bacterium]|jgi:hypothetical protein|nr:hypothetical protein [Thermoguttaceae bacterium]MDI9442867.1 hypothetical protein [Planctomycetota bacterium]NLZ00275.1 hypothetical protein [Pirellulaceae bacterium]
MCGSQRSKGLFVLAILAFALRLGVVAALWSDHAAPVSYEHGRIAENLLAGRGFSIELLGAPLRPTSQQAPFYPFFLAGIYACLGIESPAAILAVELIQCLAGTGLVLAVVALGWSLAPDRPAIGWLAGIGAAVYPTHLYAVTHLQVAIWAALVLTLLLTVVSAPRYRATWRGASIAGVLAGVLLLVEPILAIALPCCALAFWLGGLRGRGAAPRSASAERVPPDAAPAARRLLGATIRTAAMAAVATIVVAPWIVRNWRVHGEWVFVKSTFGYAFWQGNNPASSGTDKVPRPAAERLRLAHDGTPAGIDRALWEARHETTYIDDLLLKPGGYRELAGLTETKRCRLLGRKALQFIRSNPDRYARLCADRLRYFLLFDETNPKAANRIYRLSTVVWLVLATVGLMASLGRWRSLWPTYAIFAAVTLFHTLVITSVRFRIPIEPLSFTWPAAALAPLLVHAVPGTRLRVYRPGERRGAAPAEGRSGDDPRRERRAA